MAREHVARKRFGQNFLQDPAVIQQIVATIRPTPDQHLVEIGPGQGAITADLVSSGCQLDLIELDRDLVPRLRERFAGQLLGAAQPRLRIHNADALRFDFASLDRGQPMRIVGNLPYNIATPLIFHLLDFAAHIQDMHFMLQLEVVERLAAAPGERAWGKLGVMVQYHCQVDKLFEVPPTAFRPAPRVQSAIVRLVPRPRSDAPPGEEARLRQVVQAAFSQRRKTLRNTLRDLVSVQQLEQLGIAPGARAETLTLQQFIAISQHLEAPEPG